MWQRIPFPNIFPGNVLVQNDLAVTGNSFLNGQATIRGTALFNDMVYVSKNYRGNVQFDDPTNTRTPEGLQITLTMQNSWTTDAAGSREQLTLARYPGGWVEMYGVIRTSVAASRNAGTIIGHMNATSFSQTFKPVAGIFTFPVDGRTDVANFVPVIQLSYDGNIRCYNFAPTVSGSLDYRIHCTYNVFTRPGYNEGTGGGP